MSYQSQDRPPHPAEFACRCVWAPGPNWPGPWSCLDFVQVMGPKYGLDPESTLACTDLRAPPRWGSGSILVARSVETVGEFANAIRKHRADYLACRVCFGGWADAQCDGWETRMFQYMDPAARYWCEYGDRCNNNQSI